MMDTYIEFKGTLQNKGLWLVEVCRESFRCFGPSTSLFRYLDPEGVCEPRLPKCLKPSRLAIVESGFADP